MLLYTLDNTFKITDNDSIATWVYTSRDKLLFLNFGCTCNCSAGESILAGIFLLTVYRVQRMQVSTNAYLCNVAISDIPVCISELHDNSLHSYGINNNTEKGDTPFKT